MKYAVTQNEIEELAEHFKVGESFMRLMLNHINEMGVDLHCSIQVEIEYYIRNPKTISVKE
jgi:hypothetical protein